MIFGAEMLDAVLAGTKTVTRRHRRYVPGRDYAIQPGRGKRAIGRLHVVDAVEVPLRGIFGVGEARREGFDGPGAFIAYWEKLYGECKLDEKVWRIEFWVIS